MSDEKTQQLVLSIIDFLNGAIEDGTVKSDDKEGLEVAGKTAKHLLQSVGNVTLQAVQCIGEAFGVDPVNAGQREMLSIKPATLHSIFEVFLKTRERVSSSSTSRKSEPSTEAKAEAEKLKQEGNQHMSAKSFDLAIASYSKAITLDGENPVFYSNRAAAYSSKGDQHNAIADAEKAIDIDASFTKAYHRLGYAHFSLGQFEAAKSAFTRGLELDPNNAAMKAGLENAKTQSELDGPPIPPAETPPSAGAGTNAGVPNLEDMMRNLGGGGGGGMPDMASIMNNPMMRQMAQSMMANGGMERMMQNPAVANMMNRMNSGGGMPSMQEIMSDPSLRELAQSFMGGGGGR